MSDWKAHIDGEPGTSAEPRVKGSGVQVEAVLRLLSNGWTIERVLARFPGLSPDDVSACLDYAVALLERAKMFAEIRRRIELDDADPDRGISLDDAEQKLLELEQDDDE